MRNREWVSEGLRREVNGHAFESSNPDDGY